MGSFQCIKIFQLHSFQFHYELSHLFSNYKCPDLTVCESFPSVEFCRNPKIGSFRSNSSEKTSWLFNRQVATMAFWCIVRTWNFDKAISLMTPLWPWPWKKIFYLKFIWVHPTLPVIILLFVMVLLRSAPGWISPTKTSWPEIQDHAKTCFFERFKIYSSEKLFNTNFETNLLINWW